MPTKEEKQKQLYVFDKLNEKETALHLENEKKYIGPRIWNDKNFVLIFPISKKKEDGVKSKYYKDTGVFTKTGTYEIRHKYGFFNFIDYIIKKNEKNEEEKSLITNLNNYLNNKTSSGIELKDMLKNFMDIQDIPGSDRDWIYKKKGGKRKTRRGRRKSNRKSKKNTKRRTRKH